MAQSELEVLEREILRVRNDLPKQDSVPQRGVQIRNSLALAVAPLEWKGRILAREGKADEAIALLHRALEEEKKIGYSEPPLYPHPTEEVLGQTLLNLGCWSEAETMFDAAIERDHGSGRALFGLMQALQREGKGTKARETYLQFVKAWARADSDLPEMRHPEFQIVRFWAGVLNDGEGWQLQRLNKSRPTMISQIAIGHNSFIFLRVGRIFAERFSSLERMVTTEDL